jgi:hypothetical protein
MSRALLEAYVFVGYSHKPTPNWIRTAPYQTPIGTVICMRRASSVPRPAGLVSPSIRDGEGIVASDLLYIIIYRPVPSLFYRSHPDICSRLSLVVFPPVP